MNNASIYLATAITAVLLAPIILLYIWLSPPIHPRNIPSAPFYLSLLPLWRPIDQETLYHAYLAEPMRRHGAVKIFFAARWNILVGRADMMARVLRDSPQDTFRKSGNQEKIPRSVLAHFLGDNVISASGERWRMYRRVVKMGVDAGWDGERLMENACRLRDILEERGDHGRAVVGVQELFQRYMIANTADLLLHMDVKPLDFDSGDISDLQTRVKRRIFQPLFLALPVLDSLPFTGRWRDRLLVDEFSNTLQAAMCRGKYHDPSRYSLGQALVDARDSGLFAPKQFRDNVNITFTASQENPQIALTTIMYLLAKHQHAQTKLQQELDSSRQNSPDDDLDQLPYLNATILECLRLYPPLSQLINRVTKAPTVLAPATPTSAAVVVPGGMYVGYLGYATNRDEAVWGADASEFRPERWGATTAEILATRRRAGARGGFITFHGGRRACLGERYAMDVLGTTVACVLGELRVLLVPGVRYTMTPAGPLYPWDLKLLFEPRHDTSV